MDAVIAVLFVAMLFLLPIGSQRVAATSGDPATLSYSIIFGYVAALLFASGRWSDSSYLFQFLAKRTPAAWMGTGFAILSMYLLVTWAF
jgi:hypothetical protein